MVAVVVRAAVRVRIATRTHARSVGDDLVVADDVIVIHRDVILPAQMRDEPGARAIHRLGVPMPRVRQKAFVLDADRTVVGPVTRHVPRGVSLAHHLRHLPVARANHKLTNNIVEGPIPIRDDVGAQPTESEEVVSTALGGDWEYRGIRTPSKDLYPSRIVEQK